VIGLEPEYAEGSRAEAGHSILRTARLTEVL
jgi:hypothetical protein